MGKYVIRRLLLLVPTAVVLSLLVFGLLRVIPGDVVVMMFADAEGGGDIVSESALTAIRERLGLNRPLYAQYLSWIWDMARGNFGLSLLTRQPIGEQIIQRMPITVQLATMSLIIALVIGIPVGVLSAARHGSWIDQVLRFGSVFFLAAPTFWLGLIVILAGSMWFKWSPPLGYNTLWASPRENLAQLFWPALIMGFHGLAIIARMTRSTMLEVLREDYIRTARSKGLVERVVIARHALKNALIPVVTLAGLSFAQLMGGAVVLELIFGIPGIGSWLIVAVLLHDYTVIQGLIVVFAVTFMLVNLVVDLLYGWLDPRISYS